MVMFDIIVDVYKKVILFNVKNMLFYFMSFIDKEIVNKMLDIVLIDLVIFVNILYMVVSVLCNLEDKILLYLWMNENLDVFIGKMFDYYVLRMLEFVFIICDIKNFNFVKVFYVLFKEKY